MNDLCIFNLTYICVFATHTRGGCHPNTILFGSGCDICPLTISFLQHFLSQSLGVFSENLLVINNQFDIFNKNI
jgi:hypothetical protein